MNDLPLRNVGRNHAGVCHLPPSGKPLKDIVLTLNLAVQVGLRSEDIEFKVYTSMDVDDLPVNVDEPRGLLLGTAPDKRNIAAFQWMEVSKRRTLPHRLQREWERWDSGTLQDQKLMYRKKWEIMTHSKQPLFPFQFRHIPWPIFRSGERYPEINTPSVEYFIFGETRGTPPTEESKKENLKLFHSDKFTLVLGRVLPVDREWARHGAEAVYTCGAVSVLGNLPEIVEGLAPDPGASVVAALARAARKATIVSSSDSSESNNCHWDGTEGDKAP
ncbi:hypothetical protein B0H13DRAFT_1858993 [Mycena leptocephala]|nr:hypothetical protein B0H13DRAFT_1858993 [Mycena leptocephala]